MALEVVVPEVGEAGMDVVFVGWHKREGDTVRAGEPLFELDTSKATMDVEAFADGTLADLRAVPGDVVAPRQVVALLLAEGESLGPPEPAPPAPAPPRAMPRARALAREHGLDLAEVVGSGPGGTITVADVERRTGAADGARRAERTRAAVAERTSAAWRSVPHVHLSLEADVTQALERLRPTVAICRAIVGALERHPECNLRWGRGGRPEPRAGVDLGVLVDTDHGLLLPAVRDAHRLDAAALDTAIAAAAERARAGSLCPDDEGARSVSVSNLGMFAVDAFAGVIAAPDVLLLAAGRARPAARLERGAWVERSVMTLTLAVDHRALDGADGGRLLGTVEELLADPEALA